MTQSGGFALLCDAHGNIAKVLSASLGLEANIRPGLPFSRLAAGGSLAKALSFVTEIAAHGAAYDWEINIVDGEQVQTLVFTGSKLNEGMLIVRAENSKFVQKLFNEMAQMCNEQTNTLSAAFLEHNHPERNHSQYNEISHLNNELVSMQRELAKKSAELEHLNPKKPLSWHGSL